jgi:hypothetical protein
VTEPEDDATSRWVLRTPTRSWECWFNPALLVIVAVGLATGSVVVSEPLAIRAGATLAAVAIIVGAVVLGWAGRIAYVEQDAVASWQLHVTAILVGHGSAAVVALLGLATEEPVLAFAAAISVLGARRLGLGARPRADVVVAMWTGGVIGLASLARAVIGFREHPSMSNAAWFLPALLAAAFAYYLVVDGRALRTAPAR